MPYTTLGIPTTLYMPLPTLFVGVHPPVLPSTDTLGAVLPAMYTRVG